MTSVRQAGLCIWERAREKIRMEVMEVFGRDSVSRSVSESVRTRSTPKRRAPRSGVPIKIQPIGEIMF